MSSFSRVVIAAAAGSALLGLSACAGGPAGGTTGGGGESTAPAPSALESFDPCNFFTPEELAASGVAGPGEPDSDLSAEPGCNFTGDKMDLALYKAPTTSFDQYMSSGNFGNVQPFDADGRKAAIGVTAGSEGQGVCSSFLDAAGGTIIVTVTAGTTEPVEPCGESRRVAEQISPRLPQ